MIETAITQVEKQHKEAQGINVLAELSEAHQEILTDDALNFVADLHEKFNKTRIDLLQKRQSRQSAIDDGKLPDFLPHTSEIRNASWQVSPIPNDLLDRRVEITGPVNRKMVINALNAGAKVFMADFEDSNTPTWENIMDGQVNLRDAVNGTISYETPKKKYQLNEEVATLMVRPRGWHLVDKSIQINGEEVSGSLLDFGLYFFHNWKKLLENGSGPYFYLPKLESHLEARLWNDVFLYAQDCFEIQHGTIKATVLIETILAAFEMDEILYELKEHSAGLNCGRWDYIFSYIKKFRNYPYKLMPDRSAVTMGVHFMASYSKLVIKTCHKRGAHAMGGMAAQIPIKNDPLANVKAMEKVKNDKLTEVKNGHDGTWVAHPGLVPVAMEIFDEYMPAANQIEKQFSEEFTAADLLAVPYGNITAEGIRNNINVGILYIESWLQGNGAAALYNLMEDAATAEISRAQIWQWLQNNALLEDGRTFTKDLYVDFLMSEIEEIKNTIGEVTYQNGRFDEAVSVFNHMVESEVFEEFLTLPAYEIL